MDDIRSLADLLDLQAVDLELDRLLHRRESLPELQAYRAAHDRLEKLTRRAAAARDQLQTTTRELDKTNGELEIAEQKLTQEEMRLFAGGISARDADFLRQEVEMLGRQNRKMEDHILDLMETRETEEKALADLDAEVEGAGADKARLEELIKKAWREIDAEIARREERKASITPAVAPDLLELYEELRPRRDDGVAVGRLADGVCGACHLTLSAAEQTQVVREHPPRCIHCRAILVP